MRTTNGTAPKKTTLGAHGSPWLIGALSLVSVALSACNHGWIWDGTDKGGPGTGGALGGDGTGGIYGGPGVDAGYGVDGVSASGGIFGCADGGLGFDSGPAVGTGGLFGDGGFGTGGGMPTGLGTGGAIGTACFSVTFDHDVLCENITGAKDQAYADCQAHGLDLVDFGPAGSCLVGVGDQRRLSYTCCPHTDPSPPARDPATCVSRLKGDDQTCQSDLTLAALAAADCEASNYDVADAQPFAECGGDGHRFLSYACCTRDGTIIPPAPPQPATMTPFDGPIVPGPSRYAEYKCCTSPTSCTVQKLGSDATCNSAQAWNTQAMAACSATGGSLYGVPLFVSCTL